MTTSQPHDDFERAAGALVTSTSGDVWTMRDTGPYDSAGNPIAQVPSIFTLDGLGHAVADGTQAVDHLQFATLDHGSGDCDIETEWSNDPTTFTGVGLVFRWQDATHYWNTFVYNAGGLGPQVFLERQNGSTFADASPRINVNTPGGPSLSGVLRVIAQGDDIEVWFNGLLAIAVTNSSFATAPHHGISNFHSASSFNYFNHPGESDWCVGFVGSR